jgi:SAM-dependent methyltransferase
VTDYCVDGVQSPAEVYEDFLVRWQFRPWTAVLLAEAAIRPGERILDLATGTGIVAREAAPFVGERGRIVALDINPAMMAVGRSLPEPAGASIEWLEGDAAALLLPDAAFDAVLCQRVHIGGRNVLRGTENRFHKSSPSTLGGGPLLPGAHPCRVPRRVRVGASATGPDVIDRRQAVDEPAAHRPRSRRWGESRARHRGWPRRCSLG